MDVLKIDGVVIYIPSFYMCEYEPAVLLKSNDRVYGAPVSYLPLPTRYYRQCLHKDNVPLSSPCRCYPLDSGCFNLQNMASEGVCFPRFLSLSYDLPPPFMGRLLPSPSIYCFPAVDYLCDVSSLLFLCPKDH